MKERGRARRYLLNLAVMSGAILVALTAVEIGFRIHADQLVRKIRAKPVPPFVSIACKAHVPSTDPELTFEYGANHSDPAVPDFSNSVGMRGPERPIEKPPNTVRIAGLGDSVMAGDAYPYEQTFPFVLANMLNDAATSPLRFESLNFAVSGYNTREEAVVLRKKALAYAPDWVLLGVVVNDRHRSVYYRVPDARGNAGIVSREYMEYTVPFSAGLGPGRKPWWANSVLLRWIHYRKFVKVDRREGILMFVNAFHEIAETCHRNGIRILAVTFTEDVAVSQGKNPRHLWHDLVRDTARDANVPLLDTYEPVLAHLEEESISSYKHYWTSPHDPHPSPEGHRLFAEIIFEKLESLGILDQKPR